MSFSKEFFEWSGSEGEYDFLIKEISSGMLPGDKRPKSCEGIGFVSMYKEKDGTLMLEMKIDENNTKFKKFIEVKSEFLSNQKSSEHL